MGGEVEYNARMQVIAYFGSSAHWLIFAIVCLLVFGAKRLPDVARNLGKSLGVLKKAKREFEEELMREQNSDKPTAAPTQAETKLDTEDTEKKD